MKETWIEEIKRNDEMTMRDRYFPGKSCGNAECERQYFQILKIYLSLNIATAKLYEAIGRNTFCSNQHCECQTNCRFARISSCNTSYFSDSGKEYIFQVGNDECEKCRRLDGIKVSGATWNDEKKMNNLGFWKQSDGTYKPHPHCKCRWAESSANTTNRLGTIPAYKLIKLLKVLIDLDKLKYTWKNQIPKPPRMTKHKAWWSIMTWMWFFEQGPNPIYFSKDSPQSQDLANSYSVKELLSVYKKTGEFPDRWEFSGPKTAKYELGELEWFIGTYSIRNFKVDKKKHIISFTAYNKSSWHSGTRLPKTWQDYIQEKTGYKVKDLVSSEPRGKVLQNKIHKLILNSDLKNPIIKGIVMKLAQKLPSFGGDWEQYYEVEVPSVE